MKMKTILNVTLFRYITLSILSLEYSQTGRDQYKIFGFLDSFLELKTNNCYFEFIIDQFLDYLLLS